MINSRFSPDTPIKAPRNSKSDGSGAPAHPEASAGELDVFFSRWEHAMNF